MISVLEGSSPSDKRLQSPKLAETIPFIDEALTLEVEQFSFTGGEPFLVKDIIDILTYASTFKPCLVADKWHRSFNKKIRRA